MKCAICNRVCNMAIDHVGAYCSDVHMERLVDRTEALYASLLEESLEAMPDTFSVETFERYALKFAVHGIHRLTPATKTEFERSRPHLLEPHAAAMLVKQLVLSQIPLRYLEIEETHGSERIAVIGRYSFLEPVPRRVVLAAFARAGLLA